MTSNLPPGQRESQAFPRFGLPRFAFRFPKESSIATVEVCGNVERDFVIRDPLAGLLRLEQTSDFHCVSTWTRCGLRWGGVRFADFYQQVLLPQAGPQPTAIVVALAGQDGARTGMLLSDLMAPEVMLADRLDGEPLTVDHGAPLRVIAPAHYGYKSVKHLCRIEFRMADAGYRTSGHQFMDHPRARVAYEERGRGLPGWLFRYLYRPLVPGTAALYSLGMRRYRRAARRP